ncbi:helix-turn-helix transcriptional regulator [Thermoactinospora rubra]|uniref:helix-turn-helix transcriptional regulator n=1 Tax=Thermoactinospora rubra TaxID=1088767 RepID=UPI00197DB1FC|nr:response regulator transcription factor [Thermoactinospora rubra]
MFRQGVAVVLSEAGYAVEAPEDVLAWLRPGRRSLVLLTLEREQDWDVLAKLRDAEATDAVIALVGKDVAVLGVKAVRTGARSVLPREVSAGTLRRTVEATVDGQAVLPAAVAAALARDMPAGATTSRSPTPEQLAWLRQLAAGATVAQLADRAGYSERAMFRLLQSLYKEMGVRTRIQAIIRAQELGWLHVEAGRPG